MKRPLQILLLLTTLIFSAGLTIGLTYAPCYASLCSEDFYPYETRLHVATFYSLISSVGLALCLRASSPSIKRMSRYNLTRHALPVLGCRISVGGLLLSIWLVGIILATTGFWVEPLISFFGRRTDLVDWGTAKIRLAVTGIIGHHADMLLGLLIIPVSRNSLLGSVFEVHQSTLLLVHKLVAYLTVIAALAHGAAYYTFVGAYRPAPETSKDLFNIDNPTLTVAESEARGYWYYATLPTGMIAFLAMLVIVITSLPILRRKSYNTFYYVHIIGSVIVFVTTSVHASTDFYFLFPGLVLWIMDWVWRLLRGENKGLRKRVSVQLENAGEGWLRIRLPVSARTTSSGGEQDVQEEEKEIGEANFPLQTYYIVLPSVSNIQNHAFTAASVGTATSGPILLFQRSAAANRKPKKLEKEWTWKAGALVPDNGSMTALDARIEGPYLPKMPSLLTAAHIVCIVGGTGITGALCIARWWLNHRSHCLGSRLSLIWTVRYKETANITEWLDILRELEGNNNVDTILHVSSEKGRLNVEEYLSELLMDGDGTKDSSWVYGSGPDSMLVAVEDACVNLERKRRTEMRKNERQRAVGELEWYVAKWEV